MPIKGSNQADVPPKVGWNKSTHIPTCRKVDEPQRPYAKPWLNRTKAEREEYQFTQQRLAHTGWKKKSVRKKPGEATSDLALRMAQKKQKAARNRDNGVPVTTEDETEGTVTDDNFCDAEVEVKPDNNLEGGEEDEAARNVHVAGFPLVIGKQLDFRPKSRSSNQRPSLVLSSTRKYTKPWMKKKASLKSMVAPSVGRNNPAAKMPKDSKQSLPGIPSLSAFPSALFRDSEGNMDVTPVETGPRTKCDYENGVFKTYHELPEPIPSEHTLFHSTGSPVHDYVFDHLDEGLSFDNSVQYVTGSRQNVTFFNYNFDPYPELTVPLRKKATFGNTLTNRVFQTGPGKVPRPKPKTARHPLQPTSVDPVQEMLMQSVGIPLLEGTKYYRASEAISKTGLGLDVNNNPIPIQNVSLTITPAFVSAIPPEFGHIAKAAALSIKKHMNVNPVPGGAISSRNQASIGAGPESGAARNRPGPVSSRVMPKRSTFNTNATTEDSTAPARNRPLPKLLINPPARSIPRNRSKSKPRVPMQMPSSNNNAMPSIQTKSLRRNRSPTPTRQSKTRPLNNANTFTSKRAPAATRAPPKAAAVSRYHRDLQLERGKQAEPKTVSPKSRSRSESVSPHTRFFGTKRPIRSKSKRQYLEPELRQNNTTKNPSSQLNNTSNQPKAQTNSGPQTRHFATTTDESSSDDFSLEPRDNWTKWGGGITPEMLTQPRDKPIEFMPRKALRKIRREEREKQNEIKEESKSIRPIPGTSRSRPRTRTPTNPRVETKSRPRTRGPVIVQSRNRPRTRTPTNNTIVQSKARTRSRTPTNTTVSVMKNMSKTWSRSKKVKSASRNGALSKTNESSRASTDVNSTQSESQSRKSDKSILKLFGRSSPFNDDDSDDCEFGIDGSNISIPTESSNNDTGYEDISSQADGNDTIDYNPAANLSDPSATDSDSEETSRRKSAARGIEFITPPPLLESDMDEEYVEVANDDGDEQVDDDNEVIVNVCPEFEVHQSSPKSAERAKPEWRLPNTESFTIVCNEDGQKVRIYADGRQVIVPEAVIYPTRSTRKLKGDTKRQKSTSRGSQRSDKTSPNNQEFERRPKSPLGMWQYRYQRAETPPEPESDGLVKTPLIDLNFEEPVKLPFESSHSQRPVEPAPGQDDQGSDQFLPTPLLPPPPAFSSVPLTAVDSAGRKFYPIIDPGGSGSSRIIYVPAVVDYAITRFPSPLSFEPPSTASISSQSHWEYLEGGMGAQHCPLPPPPTYQYHGSETRVNPPKRQEKKSNRKGAQNQELSVPANPQKSPKRAFRNSIQSYDLPTYDECRSSRLTVPAPAFPELDQYYPAQQLPVQVQPQDRNLNDFRYNEPYRIDADENKQQTTGHPPPPARPDYDIYPRLPPEAFNPPIGVPDQAQYQYQLHPDLKSRPSHSQASGRFYQFGEHFYQEISLPIATRQPLPAFIQQNQEQIHYNLQAFNNIPFPVLNKHEYNPADFYNEPSNNCTKDASNPEPESHYPGLMKEISQTSEVMEDIRFFNQRRMNSRTPPFRDQNGCLIDLISFEERLERDFRDELDFEEESLAQPVRATESRSAPNTAVCWRNEKCKRDDFKKIFDALAPINKRVSRDALPTEYSIGNIPPPAQSPASSNSSNASVRVLTSRRNNTRAGTGNTKTVLNCPCFACRKAAGFPLSSSRSMSTLDEPNYVRKNIKDMKKYAKPAPTVVQHVVDHPKGDRVPPMIFYAGRKGFGKVPLYIKKRKEMLNDEKRIRELEEAKEAEQRAKEERRLELIRRSERRAALQRKRALEARILQHKRNFAKYNYDRNNNLLQSHIDVLDTIPTRRNYAETNIFIGPYHPSVDVLENEHPLCLSKTTTNMTDQTSIAGPFGMSAMFQEAQSVPAPIVLPESEEPDESHEVIPLKSISSSNTADNHLTKISSKNTAISRDDEVTQWMRRNSDESVVANTRKREMADDQIFNNMPGSYLLRRGTSSAPGRVIPPVINPRLSHHHFCNNMSRLCQLRGLDINTGVQMVQSTPDTPTKNILNNIS